ncbi:hypothetical protein E3P79_00693 [Wallemia ichthyophaga]|nr:hypothetical protein E3P97_00695 [Wallemia ichthyophaga]TIB61172.1 hypothetical protein E3P79_00693 [Wallemia ichthyophaga]
MEEFIKLAKNKKLNLPAEAFNDSPFMAICGILAIHKRALSPLEIAKELKQRNWSGFSGNAPATSINNIFRHRESTNIIRKHKLSGTANDDKILPHIGISSNVSTKSNRAGKSPWEAAGVIDPYRSSKPTHSSNPSNPTKRRFSDRITNQPIKSRKLTKYPISPANSDHEDKNPQTHRRLRSNHTVDMNLDLLDDLPKPSSKPKNRSNKPAVVSDNPVLTPPSPPQSQTSQQQDDDFLVSIMSPSDTFSDPPGSPDLPKSPGSTDQNAHQNTNYQPHKSTKLASMSSLEKELDELSPLSNQMDCVESKDDVICNLATPPLSPRLSDDLSVDALEELDTLWTHQVNRTRRADSLVDRDLFNSLNYVESIRAAARQ